MRRRFVAAPMVTLALVLTGCGSSDAALSGGAAAALQDAVHDVAAAAAQGRFDAAVESVAAARSVLEAAADAGEISVQRYRAVDDALTRTEQELEVVLAARGPADAPAEPDASPATDPTPEVAPPEVAPPVVPPATVPSTTGDVPEERTSGTDDGGKGNGKGKGENKGNGNGRGRQGG